MIKIPVMTTKWMHVNVFGAISANSTLLANILLCGSRIS
jgi:hypothetical protein